MKIVLLVGSIVGTKTRIAVRTMEDLMKEENSDSEIVVLDLGKLDVIFSDGRQYFEYEGDTNYVATQLMEADGIIIGTPTFQSSIPGTLKNVFDLLPIYAFRDKQIGIIATAGSSKHFLMVEHHLKPILSYMKGEVIPSYVFIEEKDYEKKVIVNHDTIVRLKRLRDQLLLNLETLEKRKKEIDSMYDF